MEPDIRTAISPEKSHQRQAAWQIWLPFSFGVLVFLGLSVLAGFALFNDWDAGDNWAAFSVILWILPSCLGGLVGLALAIGSVVVASKALGNLPEASHGIQTTIYKLQKQIEGVANKMADPVIKTASQKAGWDRFWELFRNKPK